MEKEWMKLIDDVENNRSYNADPNFKFVDFIREKWLRCGSPWIAHQAC